MNIKRTKTDVNKAPCFPKGIKFGFDRPEFGEIVILCQSLRWVCRVLTDLNLVR